MDILPSVTDSDLPKREELRALKMQYTYCRPEIVRVKDGLALIDNKIQIPTEASEIKLILIVIANTATAGHRGVDATFDILKQIYYWKQNQNDVQEFVKGCLHLVGTSQLNEGRLSRTLVSGYHDPQMHATSPNELVHFDYLYMGESTTGHKYVFVVLDGLSSYVRLTASEMADAHPKANVLPNWIDAFTVMDMWGSDQGTHFKIKLWKTLPLCI